MPEQTQLAKQEYVGAMEVREQVNAMQHLMGLVMKEGTHYGKIPGTGDKPTLLQPGAEKICNMFHLVPRSEVSKTDLGGGHREYEVHTTLTSRDTGEVMGEGFGSCSTLESKYRYRSRWVNNKKVREENPDIADTYNTVLKMAKKRALVDATKSTTAASDIFTQDVEDMPDWMLQRAPKAVAVQADVAPQADPDRVAAMQSYAARLASITGMPVDDAKRALMAQGDFRTMDEEAWQAHRQRMEATVQEASKARDEALAPEASYEIEEEAK